MMGQQGGEQDRLFSPPRQAGIGSLRPLRREGNDVD
jgi:hypothetical protein